MNEKKIFFLTELGIEYLGFVKIIVMNYGILLKKIKSASFF